MRRVTPHVTDSKMLPTERYTQISEQVKCEKHAFFNMISSDSVESFED